MSQWQDYDQEDTREGINVTRKTGVKPQPNEQGKIALYISHERKSERSPVLGGYVDIPLDMIQAAVDADETYDYQGVVYLRTRVSIFPQNTKKKNAKAPDYSGYINRVVSKMVDQDRQEVRDQFTANRTPIR